MTPSHELSLSGAERADILDLYGRYGLAIDFGDGSGWAELFTPAGTFTAIRGEGVDPRYVAGREQLERFAREHRVGPLPLHGTISPTSRRGACQVALKVARRSSTSKGMRC